MGRGEWALELAWRCYALLAGQQTAKGASGIHDEESSDVRQDRVSQAVCSGALGSKSCWSWIEIWGKACKLSHVCGYVRSSAKYFDLECEDPWFHNN